MKLTIHLVVQNFKIRPGTVKPNFSRGREGGGLEHKHWGVNF